MKPVEEIDMAKVKECCKELNGLGILEKNIKIVAVSNEDLIQSFTEAVEDLAKAGKQDQIPVESTHLYNFIYQDESAGTPPPAEGEGAPPAEEEGTEE